TGKLSYGETTFLIDPMLAERGYYEGFAGTFNSELRNPLLDLPAAPQELLKDVDAVVVTHTHLDHWDDFAVKYIDKQTPIIVQNKLDADIIKKQGFSDVRILATVLDFQGVKLTHVEGMHGTSELFADPLYKDAMMNTMGIVFEKPGEKTSYVLGDTIWTGLIDLALRNYDPKLIIMNTGYAKVLDYNASIIMGIEDVKQMAKKMPKSQIIAVHMDAINHCTVSRKNLHDFVKMHQLQKQVWIPYEGDLRRF
nr:MBL fold metallo-hydrolase [Succinivibrio sp.]